MCADSVQNGRFKFTLNYRTQGGDRGLSIRILGDVKSEERELLRFDCFENAPHYHTAVYDHNTIRKIDEDDVVAWALGKIDSEFESLIAAAGGDPVSDSERDSHADAIAELRSKSDHVIAAAQE